MPRSHIVYGAIAATVIAMLTPAQTQAAGKERILVDEEPRRVVYRDVSFNELIAVYKQAYSDAGLEFRELIRQRPTVSHLIFELPYRERLQPHFSVVRSYWIVSSAEGDQICAPCSVSLGMLVGDPRNYSREDFNTLAKRIRAADLAASARIKAKLGKAYDFEQGKKLRGEQARLADFLTDAGELLSLNERGVVSFITRYTLTPEQQNGNWLLERSIATLADGGTVATVDGYFEITEGDAANCLTTHQW